MSNQQQAHEFDLRHEIVRIGKLLYERGLIVAGDGNISARLHDELVLITPSGACKGMLAPDDMIVVSLSGEVIQSSKGRKPSSEQTLHLQVYQARSDVQAVVHAHPPTAVGATIAGVSMTEPLVPETILALGPVPSAPYALTGTMEMFEAIAPFIANHHALLLSHHGALTFGSSLQRAFMRMEQIEHCAKILLAAHQFGGARPLPAQRIAELEALRATIPQFQKV